MGADRAVLVSDPAAAGSDLVATSLRSQRPGARAGDLILFGQQSSDSDGAVLGRPSPTGAYASCRRPPS
jgi:electron transfer flavoprotein alpha/beta subunit